MPLLSSTTQSTNLAVLKPQAKAKELGDDEATGIDYDYIEALE
mgnify:CR=1 FL=1